ncbi:protein HGV2 isoform X2 [Parasteatoda tepidariorum]|uniref:protein HGV2 isoform X2 n=1 Tax=Parasteatoda tepidariorum TaxID=114398 RepID=UPI00077FA91D|nr:protein HGV2 isoform X2 [Parasteatoda tepidariorum]
MDETKEIKTDSTSDETLAPANDSNKTEEMDVTPIDGAPSRSKDLSKTLPEEAFNNFIQGKRHMLVQDYTFAVQSLAVACELYVKHFGELAVECGEVYFLYGKSLIRYAQSQSQRGVLGDAINKVPGVANDDDDCDSTDEEENENENESESGEDKEKEGEKNGSATEENETETEEKEPSESTDSPQHVENEVDSKEKEPETNAAEPDVSRQNESSNEENPEAEDDDLELAWNILEAAKSIFMRQGEENKEAQLKVAEILQLLAETSLETDNYPQAISDLKSCLSIQEKHLAPDDRILAHTYYQLGLAYMLQKMYDGAIENFVKTKKLFELRKENLKNTPVSETVGGFEAAERQKELEEIDGIITDIKEKIEDTEELVRNAKNELQEAIIKKEQEAEIEFGKPTNPTVSSSKPVSNITHLLKRKVAK